MARTGHYVKRAERCSAPRCVIAVVPRPWHHWSGPEREYERQTWRSCELATCRWSRGRWTGVRTIVTDSAQETLRIVREWSIPRGLTWVISPSVSDTLTLLGWWDYVDQANAGISDGVGASGFIDPGAVDLRAVRVSRLTLGGPPDIVQYVEAGRRYRWCSAANWWPDSGTQASGDAHAGHGTRSGGVGTVCAPDDKGPSGAGALLGRVRGLCDWWRRVSRASLGCTASACAWGILRSHIAPRVLSTHTDDDAHRLERASAHGGRATVWYVGAVEHGRGEHGVPHDEECAPHPRHTDGAVYSLDVSSMYPWLLRDRVYPVRLRQIHRDVRPEILSDWLRSCGVIARVTFDTRHGEYPCRVSKGTRYPIGRHTSTLAGPDLAALDREGAICEVHECATYDLGNPWRDALQVLLDERADARDRHDADAEALSKLLANSLAGRMAMRIGGWERWPIMDQRGKWGEEWEVNRTTGERARYRWVHGQCSVWQPEKCPRGPHTSVFSYLTAYGRQHMRAIREACPTRSVYAQNTDGLYMSAVGIRAVGYAGMLGGVGPGALRVVGRADSAQWYGPRHYRFGAKWVLAGWHSPTPPDDAGRVRYSLRTPLWSQRCRSAPTEVHVRYIDTCLPSELEGGRVQPDGWILPPSRLAGHVSDETR